MRYKASDYALKVWATSIFVGPLFVLAFSLIKASVNKTLTSTNVSGLGIILVIVLFGAILSLPSFLLFYLACRYIISHIDNVQLSKTLLSILGIILTYLPFLIIDDFNYLLDKDQLSQPLFITYSSAIIGSIWFHKFELVSKKFDATINI